MCKSGLVGAELDGAECPAARGSGLGLDLGWDTSSTLVFELSNGAFFGWSCSFCVVKMVFGDSDFYMVRCLGLKGMCLLKDLAKLKAEYKNRITKQNKTIKTRHKGWLL